MSETSWRFEASSVEVVLDDAIADGSFPGCVAAVGDAGGGLWIGARGLLGEGLGQTSTRTLYDLASLTKVVATTALAQRLVQAGIVEIEAPVARYIPDFKEGLRASITIEHLLTHSSGLPAWTALYRQAPRDSGPRGREQILRAIIETPLEYEPGAASRYSDLGAILLGESLANAARTPLATLAWREVFEPIGMRETLYRPPRRELDRIAPTEHDREYRGRMLRGEVHDENAYALGGVSAHAGLFSTAPDLARFTRELLRGLAGESGVFEKALTRRFSARRGLVEDSSRALGWDTKSPERSSAGRFFSPGSFGHTGFTGTSIWVDPERSIFAVLLTNRVHPTRANRKISAVRPRFHDAVIRGLESAR